MSSWLRSQPTLLLLISVAGAGCARIQPLEPVDITTPRAWTADHQDGDVSTTAWWRDVGGSELAGLVSEALESNHDLAVVAASLAAAEAESRVAAGARLPQVDFLLRSGRSKQNFLGLPVPGSTDVLSSTTSSHGASLNVGWEVDLWQRLGAAGVAAMHQLQATGHDLAAARLSLAGQTSKAYFGTVAARAQLELARETLASRSRTTNSVRRRFDSGLTSSLDLRFALSQSYAAEALVSLREQQLDRATRQLELLLGRYPSGDLTTNHSLEMPATPIPAGLPAELIARRPDLRAAERRLAASGARVHIARAALYPRISLTSSGGTLGSQLRDLLNGDLSVWSLASSLTQPLFHGGRIRAQIDVARAAASGAEANLVAATFRALLEVETALSDEARLTRREQALARSVAQAEAAASLSNERYASGVGSYLILLEAQRQALELRAQLVDAQLQRLTSRIDLHLALGGDVDSATLGGDS